MSSPLAHRMDAARWRGPASHEAPALKCACGTWPGRAVGIRCALGACAPLAGSMRPRGLLPLVRQGRDPVAASRRSRQWGALSRRLVGQCAKVRSESARTCICKSRALGPLQRGSPPGQDIGTAGGAGQASPDVDDSTSGDECRCALSGMLSPQWCMPLKCPCASDRSRDLVIFVVMLVPSADMQ